MQGRAEELGARTRDGVNRPQAAVGVTFAPRTLAAAGVAGAGARDSRTEGLGLQVCIYTQAADGPWWAELV